MKFYQRLGTGILLSFINILPIAAGTSYTVKEYDTLYSLSRRFHISVESIRQENGLADNIIKPGQTLSIPESEKMIDLPEETLIKEDSKKAAQIISYQVQSGDSLSGIALKTGIDIYKIRQLNNLDDDSLLKTGRILRLPGPAEAGSYYSVGKGESLSYISLLFDVSLEHLRIWNNLDSDSLALGESLLVSKGTETEYEVQPGDSLWGIAVNFGTTTEDLMALNNLDKETLKPGQILTLFSTKNKINELPPRPVLQPEKIKIENETPIALASLNNNNASGFIQDLISGVSQYKNIIPSKNTQLNTSYSEDELENPAENYRMARKLIDEWNSYLDSLPTLSEKLAGTTIILDPGHGGLDPGCIVPSSTGNGTVYVVEDEYAYDITLRVYEKLKRHGADVYLTIIAPNHLIRNGIQPDKTFINEKNEVYNLASLNPEKSNKHWPVGNRWGLEQRLKIANHYIREAGNPDNLYISIHADNSPMLGKGTTTLYYGANSKEEKASKRFAEAITPYLGSGSTSHKQELVVLQNNPADNAVLIEIRNVAFPGNSWAIRNEELRIQDADFIVNGILHFR